MLKDAKLSSHQPTNHPSAICIDVPMGFTCPIVSDMEELQIGGIKFQAHDLGGHRSGSACRIRDSWAHDPLQHVDFGATILLELMPSST